MCIAVVRGSSHSANYKACGILAYMEQSERIHWNTSAGRQLFELFYVARLPIYKDMYETELQCALNTVLLLSSLYFFPTV